MQIDGAICAVCQEFIFEYHILKGGVGHETLTLETAVQAQCASDVLWCSAASFSWPQTEAHPQGVAEGAVVRLHCHHRFHAKCILDWSSRAPTCPLCREQL